MLSEYIRPPAGRRIGLALLAVVLMCLVFSGCLESSSPERLPEARATTSPAQFAPSPDPAASDWPNFLGPHHNGDSSALLVALDWPPAGPPELWRRDVGTGYSSPVVVGNRLVIFHREGDDEIVECLAADTGKSLWQYAYSTAYECPYQYSSGPYGTPAIDNGLVFAWGAQGSLRCLELASGELVWQRDLNCQFQAELGMFPIAGSPLIEGDAIILNVGGRETDAGIVALDRRTGETLWTATDNGPGDATAMPATIHGRRFVFMFTADGLVSLDPTSGAVHWEIPFRATAPDTSNATTPIVAGDLVLVSAYKIGSLCVRVLPDGGYEEVWRDRRNLMCQFHNLIERDGFVYGFAANDHTLRCIELATGKVQWKWQPEMGRGQSVAVGDCLITVFENGQLGAIEVRPDGWKVRSLTEKPIVRYRCFSAPALAGGKLYLRSDTDLVAIRMTIADR